MRGPAAPVLLALLLATLSGCAEPPAVPDDAVMVRQPGLDGLELSAWVEQRNGFTYLRGVVHNTGDSVFETKEDCGYLWQSEVRGADGALHAYKPPSDHVCDWAYDFLRPGGHREFLHSWDGRFWNGTTASEAEAWDAPAGDHTWTLRFLLRDGSDHDTMTPVPGRFLEAQVPFRLA